MLFFNFIILLLDPDPDPDPGRIRKSWIRYIPNHVYKSKMTLQRF